MQNRNRILVIDDDPLFRSLVVAMLREHYYVSVAGDGLDAFYKALEAPPDLMVVDMKMPIWDGMTTLRRFRSHRLLSSVKALVLTGEATALEIAGAMDDGADEYFIKCNFSKPRFLASVDSLLKSRSSQLAQSRYSAFASPATGAV